MEPVTQMYSQDLVVELTIAAVDNSNPQVRSLARELLRRLGDKIIDRVSSRGLSQLREKACRDRAHSAFENIDVTLKPAQLVPLVALAIAKHASVKAKVSRLLRHIRHQLSNPQEGYGLPGMVFVILLLHQMSDSDDAIWNERCFPEYDDAADVPTRRNKQAKSSRRAKAKTRARR